MEPADIMMMNYDLFKRMKELAEKQELVIADDQMDEFNRLFDQREHIREEITANSRRYGIEMKNASYKRKDQKVNDISMDISDMIRSIQETDKRIEELIISRKDLLMDDIKNIKKGQSALKGYGGVPKKTNRFLDRNG